MDKYEGLQKVTDWIINSSSEEFMGTFNKLNDKEYSGLTLGDFLDSLDDTEEVEEGEPITEEEYEQWRKDNEDIDNAYNSKETE